MISFSLVGMMSSSFSVYLGLMTKNQIEKTIEKGCGFSSQICWKPLYFHNMQKSIKYGNIMKYGEFREAMKDCPIFDRRQALYVADNKST